VSRPCGVGEGDDEAVVVAVLQPFGAGGVSLDHGEHAGDCADEASNGRPDELLCVDLLPALPGVISGALCGDNRACVDQYGLHREATTRAPSSSATLQYGGPPMASIPKTRDQLEAPSSKRSRPCGNNASTRISRAPPTRQQMRGPTSDRQHTPHPDPGTTTGSARTKSPNGVRTGQPHPAANPGQAVAKRLRLAR
jgi:hypothetical protein